MTDMLPPDQPPRPRRLREHQVRTLPSLQHALQDLIREAHDRHAAGPINLADFDPLHGVTVSLNDDGTGNLSIRFERRRAGRERAQASERRPEGRMEA